MGYTTIPQPLPGTCNGCLIEAYGFNVYSNSTFSSTYDGGPFDPQLPTTSFVCTAFTTYSSLSSESNCSISTIASSLLTPFYVANGESGTSDSELVLSSVASYIGSPPCGILAAPISWVVTEPTQTLNPSDVSFSSAIRRSALSSQPTATISRSPTSQSTLPSQPTPTTTSSPSQYTQRVYLYTGETTKLIIGLAVALTVLILLVTIGLTSRCMIRKRRLRKNVTTTAHQAAGETGDEILSLQMYFQQKLELDDEQRRHELEDTQTGYELEVGNETHEMPAGERERCSDRPEMSDEEHSKGLDKPS